MTSYLGWSTHSLTTTQWKVLEQLLDGDGSSGYLDRRWDTMTGWRYADQGLYNALSDFEEMRIVYRFDPGDSIFFLTKRGKRFAEEFVREYAA